MDNTGLMESFLWTGWTIQMDLSLPGVVGIKYVSERHNKLITLKTLHRCHSHHEMALLFIWSVGFGLGDPTITAGGRLPRILSNVSRTVLCTDRNGTLTCVSRLIVLPISEGGLQLPALEEDCRLYIYFLNYTKVKQMFLELCAIFEISKLE